MFSKILLVLSALSVTASAFAHVPRAAEIVPLSPFGGVAAVQSENNDTRLYYQRSDGSIHQYIVSNAFNVGHTSGLDTLLIPASEVQLGTPIAITSTISQFFGEIRIYFFSPSNILSEYIWMAAVGHFRGGPSCADCLTAAGLAVVPGSKVLYAMQNPSTGSLRVGFVSAGFPSTLAEADRAGAPNSTWQVAALPN
ncbi:hypothetical protein BD779DRAFT_1679797 [Infundibulicybe gibba]|nr:hypothetical protein BD779DRAFT_1679797 [Infundibulicybe gibba]